MTKAKITEQKPAGRSKGGEILWAEKIRYLNGLQVTTHPTPILKKKKNGSSEQATPFAPSPPPPPLSQP